MHVLFVASECAPFIKTGGLADVIGSVPKALAGIGVSVKILLPAYPALDGIKRSGKTVLKISDLHGGPARLIAVQAEGSEVEFRKIDLTAIRKLSDELPKGAVK